MTTDVPSPGACEPRGSGEYYVHPVRESGQHSKAIIDTVAVLTNQDPRRMTPLATVIDPEALERLCDSSSEDARVALEFEYEDRHVVVDRTNVYVEGATAE